MRYKSFSETNLFVFLVTFLFGWATYNLKLISINKLLGDLSFNYYPFLILGQGVLLIAGYQLLKKIADKSEVFFYLSTTFVGVLVIFSTLLEDFKLIPRSYLYILIFFVSSLLIEACEIAMRVFSSNRISVLKNPRFSILILLAFEFGVIGGSLVGVYEKIFTFQVYLLIQLAPFFLLMLLLLQIKKIISFKDAETKENDDGLNFSKLPFVKLSLFLFSIIVIAKNLQGFATILAIKEIKDTSPQSLSVIFSKITFIQSALIILLLGISYQYKKKSTNWTLGFYVLLIFQFVTMLIVSFVFNPVLVIGIGVGRKVLDHSIFSDAQNMFDASLPPSFRLQLKNKIQNISLIVGLFVLGFFSYIAINFNFSKNYIWILTAGLGLLGCVVIKKLLLIFNKFHLEQIINFQKSKTQNISEIINSTYALANTSAENANLTLLMVITQRPPLPLAQAIFYALGEIKAEKSLVVMQKQFFRQKSELVRFEIINALSKNIFINSDLFFQKCILSFVENQKFPYIETRLFRSLYRLFPDVVFRTMQDQLKTAPNEDLLSYLYFMSKDHLIMIEHEIVNIFMQKNKNTMKILAALILCKIKSEKSMYIDYIGIRFKGQGDDFNTVLHVISNLDLKQFLPLILILLQEKKYSELPLLYCALTLNYSPASLHIINKIRDGDPFSLPFHLNEFYHLKDRFRFQIYEAFMEHDADFLDSLITLLVEHDCDFSDDLDLIYKEANRRHLQITPYVYNFKEY